jgi:hypothetical protein
LTAKDKKQYFVNPAENVGGQYQGNMHPLILNFTNLTFE